MDKQIIILFLMLGCFSVVKAQEKEEELFKYGVDKFKADFYPYMDSLLGNYTQESLMIEVFKGVDTIYLYDENEPKQSVITFLKSKGKTVLFADYEELDSLNLKPELYAQRGRKVLGTQSVGLIFRFEGSKKYSFRTYINTNLKSEVVNFNSGILGREKITLIVLDKDNVKRIYDDRYLNEQLILKIKLTDKQSISPNNIFITYIFPKSIFHKGILSISTNDDILNLKVNKNGKVKYYTHEQKKYSLSKEERKNLPKKEPLEGYEYLW